VRRLGIAVKDGLLAIANEVLGDVEKEAQALIQDAEEEAKNSLKKAKEQADQHYQTIVNEAKVKAEAEKQKIASLAEVEMRNSLLQRKEELVDAVFERALGKLKDFVETEQYQNYLLKLIEEAAKRIGSQNLVLYVNAKDKVWLTQDNLNRLSKKLRLELALSDRTEDCIGGCRIQTADGKITNDSTIDNRLQELKPTLRTEVAKILFGKEA
jgi:V/A-type H+-transporting ATPase subunit E